MKAKKVLKILGITRRTLTNYVNSGKIHVVKTDNGFYDYNNDDVMRLDDEKNIDNCVVIYLNGEKMKYDLPMEKVEQIMRISEII